MKVDVYSVLNPSTGNTFSVMTSNLTETQSAYRNAIRSREETNDPLVTEVSITGGFNVLVWTLVEQGVEYKRTHSPDARAKMRKAWETRSAMSDDTKKKISEKLTGKKKSPEHIENIKKALRNPSISNSRLCSRLESGTTTIPTMEKPSSLTNEEAMERMESIPGFVPYDQRNKSVDCLSRKEAEKAGIEDPVC